MVNGSPCRVVNLVKSLSLQLYLPANPNQLNKLIHHRKRPSLLTLLHLREIQRRMISKEAVCEELRQSWQKKSNPMRTLKRQCWGGSKNCRKRRQEPTCHWKGRALRRQLNTTRISRWRWRGSSKRLRAWQRKTSQRSKVQLRPLVFSWTLIWKLPWRKGRWRLIRWRKESSRMSLHHQVSPRWNTTMTLRQQWRRGRQKLGKKLTMIKVQRQRWARLAPSRLSRSTNSNQKKSIFK